MSHTADAAHGHGSRPHPRRGRDGSPATAGRAVEPIRVLIADDHPVSRQGMRAILGAEPDTELVGEATDGQEAVELALELRPDVILMDLNMPKVSGTEATRRILEASPTPPS